LDHDTSSYHGNHDVYDVGDSVQNQMVVVVDIPCPLDHVQIHRMGDVVDIPSFHDDGGDGGDGGDCDDVATLDPLDHDQIHRMVVVVDIPSFHDDRGDDVATLDPLDHDRIHQIHQMVVVVVDIPSFQDDVHVDDVATLDPLDHGRIHQRMDHASDDDDHVGSHDQILYQICLNYWN
jgi:hypothetical protein